MFVLLTTLILFSTGIDACAPSLGAPIFSAPPAPVMNIAPNPVLPATSFQLDNIFQTAPQSDDYTDDSMQTIQKNSMPPMDKQKLQFSFFDLFRPQQLSTPPSILKKDTIIEEVVMNIKFSPPVSWTFCYPFCGVGDQAVDAENAVEIARDDVKEAVKRGCENANIPCQLPTVNLTYNPESVLTESFGPLFDGQGYQYKISGKTIPYRISSLKPAIEERFEVPMTISFLPSIPLTESQTMTLKQKVTSNI